jgi:glycosyltransferase involved in cell wall biosynthesis
MRIGYDAKRAFHNRTGLGNYSRSLIDNICSFFPKDHYFLFNNKPSKLYYPEGLFIQEVLPTTFIQKKFSSFWRSFSLHHLADQYALDIFHGLSHELPFGGKKGKTKWVLTIHDLIFIRYPHYFNYIDRKIYRYKVRWACEKADKIVAISHQTKRDIIEFLDVAPEKIEVIYQDCHHSFKKEVSISVKESVRNKYNLPLSFLLQVGTIETRKNLLLTIKALKLINGNETLVVVGKRSPYLEEVKQQIAKLKLQDKVIFLHSVLFNDLPAIYQMAKIFIYPSRFEGFGIPILEALYSKVPVIAASGSCLEEAGGPSSTYVHPDNATELALAIDVLLIDQNKREHQIEQGLRYVEKFNPENLSSQLMNLYRNIL